MVQSPFEEPEDDRTVIRPRPSGTRAVPDRPAQPALSTEASLSTHHQALFYPIGSNLLLAAAEPIILLLAKLCSAPVRPFSGDLRTSTIRGLRAFEKRAQQAGVPMEQIRPAHHALCATLDDVILNTPWGASSGWGNSPLSVTLHQDPRAGEQLLANLRQFRGKPQTWMPVLEVMYLCLSLGFVGPYRTAPAGASAIEEERQRTHEVIMNGRPADAAALSDGWEGVPAPFRLGHTRFPAWVVVAGAAVFVTAATLWCEVDLNIASDRVYSRMLAAPPSVMPEIVRVALVHPPPPAPQPVEPGRLERLRRALRREQDRGTVEVLGTDTDVVIRMNDTELFSGWTANLLGSARLILEHLADILGAELRDRGGALQVNGYSDNQPVRTLKYPSSFRLSAARAEKVRDALRQGIGQPTEIAADARAEADPIDTNLTPAGRERNRRIEIVLRDQR